MLKTAWVTGASSGLGLYTAQALVREGWRVAAGARSFQGQEGEGPEGFRLPLDVTDHASIAAFCQKALAQVGTPGALVNCAGILVIGAAEDCSDQELRQVMDVNFFGMAAMVRAVLPLMRANGGGRIVNFSSVNGLFASPFQGAYSAAKHAVEGLSEALAMEVKSQGIQVMLVQPGDHRGGADKYRPLAARQSPPYKAACARTAAVMARDERGGSDPARLGKKVARALNRRRMPMRLPVAMPSQRAAIVLHDILPSGLFQTCLSAYYRVNPRRGAPQEELHEL